MTAEADVGSLASGLTPAEAPDLLDRAEQALIQLGSPPELIRKRGLPLFRDATALVIAHVSLSGREHMLTAPAARQWQRLRADAASAGLEFVVISGFRSFERQAELIAKKTADGLDIAEVLQLLAPPGCSEHHTGCAVDIGVPGIEPLSDEFGRSAVFEWLTHNAGRYGFHMSFPEGNRWGFRYEPWHWCYHGN